MGSWYKGAYIPDSEARVMAHLLGRRTDLPWADFWAARSLVVQSPGRRAAGIWAQGQWGLNHGVGSTAHPAHDLSDRSATPDSTTGTPPDAASVISSLARRQYSWAVDLFGATSARLPIGTSISSSS